MKKLLTVFALLGCAYSMNAQHLEVGLKGGYGTTWLMNKNVFDQDEELDPTASFAGQLGINATYFLNDKFGICVELNSQTIKQKYSGDTNGDASGGNFDSEDKLKYINGPILIKLQNEGGIYFEIGPQFNFLSSAKGSYDDEDSDINDVSDRDIKEGFNGTNIGLLFGFGVNINLTDNLIITTGLRLAAGFSDVTKEFSDSELVKLSTDEKIGTATSYAHIDQTGDFSYEKTTLVSGSLMLGLSYKFGN